MCVAFWSLTHPKYALILCANRDEYLARPTLPAHFHSFEALTLSAPAPSSPSRHAGSANRNDEIKGTSSKEGGRGRKAQVLSGRDILAEGTWLGISQSTGRVALLTNITEAGATYASSRGTLAASFLANPRRDPDLARVTEALTSQQGSGEGEGATTASYAGFNLLLLEPQPLPLPGTGTGTDSITSTTAVGTDALAYDARLLTNGGGGGRIRARELSVAERACGGLSNGVDGEGGDAWPKVIQGRAELQSILDQMVVPPLGGPEIADDAAGSLLAEQLIELLTARSPDPPPTERAELKNTVFVPPVTISSMAGAPPASYGTRLAQVILVRRDGRVTYIERDVWTLDGAGTPVRASAADMRIFVFRLGSDS